MYRLIANPHFCDYLHCLDFDSTEVEFLFGDCQFVRFQKTVSYQHDPDQRTYRFKVGEHKKTLHYTIEEGPFLFKEEVPYKCTDEEQPILIYSRRYVFDNDPFTIFDFDGADDSLRFYYDSREMTGTIWSDLTAENKAKLITA